VLYFLGETLNTMTLGGLALAVGILVDDSTVTIENTHRLWTDEGMPAFEATLAWRRRNRGADAGFDVRHQLRVHIGGVPRRTGQVPVHAAGACRRVCDAGVLPIVANPEPITIGLLLKSERHGTDHGPGGFLLASFRRVRPRLRALRDGYSRLLRMLLQRRAIVPAVAVLILSLGTVMLLSVGRTFSR